MILRAKENEWEIIKQDDHAFLSWQTAVNWNPDYFPFSGQKEDVLLAIRQHDRAWIPLDQSIRWNPEKNLPYDFTNYPVKEKLAAYKRGIDETEEISPYAAVLCSRHYSSFFSSGKNGQPVIDHFLQKEDLRREEIHSRLDLDNEQVAAHVKLLQFCDDLSLYICLNPPGVKKKNEFPWFKQGFRQTFPFAPEGMKAWWKDEQTIELDPFPFTGKTEMNLIFYNVEKGTGAERFEQKWKQALPEKRSLSLVSK